MIITPKEPSPEEIQRAKSFYEHSEEFWILPVDPDDTDATLRKVHKLLASYASSETERLQEPLQTLVEGLQQEVIALRIRANKAEAALRGEKGK